MLHLQVPEGGRKVLLHCCCAPCSGAVVECLVQNGIKPALFFSNSNIVPYDEYVLRRSELERYARVFGLEVIDDEYNHGAWLDFAVHGDASLASAPERGARCLNCFKFRLLRAARYGAAHGFDTLTTTLASSRWKSLEQVDAAGLWACGEVACHDTNAIQANGNLTYWPVNWRKGGLQPRRAEIIKEQCFYNQNYCGCEFSHKHESE